MRRVLVFVLLGPPLGLATFMFVMMPLLTAASGESTQYDWHQIVFLPPAYFLGTLPALTAALVDGTLARRGVRHRIWWTTAFAFTASFIPMLPSVIMGFIQTPWVLPFGIVGAIPAAICAWLAGDGNRAGGSRQIRLPEGQAPLAPP